MYWGFGESGGVLKRFVLIVEKKEFVSKQYRTIKQY
jgi:hypothetical protein